MKRAIVTPPALPPAALAELKEWLGISAAQDDAPLTALLRAALAACEGFTGLMPIEALVEEVLPASGVWQMLFTRPVRTIVALDTIAADGTRSALPNTAYTAEIDADGGGRVMVPSPGEARRIAVRFTAGVAPDWDSLPEALRHGMLRLAAHQHRERDSAGAAPFPPAAVAALWRPWRRMRLT
jgi:uncharacterized phiE125 gp8 family phage protein